MWPRGPPRVARRALSSPRSAGGRETMGPRSWAAPPRPTAAGRSASTSSSSARVLALSARPTRSSNSSVSMRPSRCAARRRRTVASRSRSDASTRPHSAARVRITPSGDRGWAPPPSNPGGQPGRSARRAAEPLGEFDDQAFGSADVAEEERVLEVDDLPDRFPAGLSDAVDDASGRSRRTNASASA